MSNETTYHSFLVRLYADPESADPIEVWRISVRHIQTGERLAFDNMDAFVHFLRRYGDTPFESDHKKLCR